MYLVLAFCYSKRLIVNHVSFIVINLQWVLSPKYFNFPLPITLTMIHMGFSGFVAFLLIRVFKVYSILKRLLLSVEVMFTCIVALH